MKFRVTFTDNIDLLITSDSAAGAVREAKILKDILKGAVKDSNYVGSKIKIIYMEGEPRYNGRTGEVTSVDGMGQLHGTWGGLAVRPGEDDFEVMGTVGDSAKGLKDILKGSVTQDGYAERLYGMTSTSKKNELKELADKFSLREFIEYLRGLSNFQFINNMDESDQAHFYSLCKQF